MLTFSYDVQHHSERREGPDHVDEGHGVLDVQPLLPGPVVQTSDQQGHEQGLEASDQQGHQVSEVVVHVAPEGEQRLVSRRSPSRPSRGFWEASPHLMRVVNCCSSPGSSLRSLEILTTSSLFLLGC